jgi:hypothetical protein
MFKESEYFKDPQSGKVKEGWYFFCVTGLNITAKLMSSLKKGLFDSFVLSVMEQEKGFDPSTILLEVFDFWYFKIFSLFHEKWLSEKKDMMAFNQFFAGIYSNQFINNYHIFLQEYIDLKD